MSEKPLPPKGWMENLDNKPIRELNVVTCAGVKTYRVGDKCGNKQIAEICKGILRVVGDPYDHYLGLDDAGELLFSVNCLAPCDIEYL